MRVWRIICRAREQGKGVLVLTGHLGAWELSSFYHSLMGMPMGMVIRRLDNPLVDEFVNRIRCLHGNRVIHKDDFARGLIASMRAGETVGILMDTNMTPPQGVFVPFFGVQACTASGMARIAAKTGAAVVPGFLLWEESERRYVLHFGEELEVVRYWGCGAGCAGEYGDGLPRRLKGMCGGIRSSGCGCIGGGRLGLQAKRGFTDGEWEDQDSRWRTGSA